MTEGDIFLRKIVISGALIALIALSGCATPPTQTAQPRKTEKVCDPKNATLTDKGAIVCKNAMAL